MAARRVLMETAEIRASYDRAARWYDLAESVPELLGMRRLRRRIMRQAKGRVLEVAAGTGKNLRWLPRDIDWTGADLSERMLSRARTRAAGRAARSRVVVMDAARLAVRDRAFDTVVSSLSSCTFPDPIGALREMARACREGGRILLIEHGRSDRRWLARFQDRHAPRHSRALGCQWNREPLELVRTAGLHVDRARRTFFGVFWTIEARPDRSQSSR